MKSSEKPIPDMDEKLAILEKQYDELQKKVNSLADSHNSKTDTPPTAQVEMPNGKIDGVETQATPETNQQSRAKILISRVDPESGERKDQLPNEISNVVSKIEEKHYAFILRKIVYDNEEDNGSEIEITSQALWNLLKGLLGHYPYHYFRGPPTIIKSPFEPFVLNWDELEEAAKEEPRDDLDRQRRSDLHLLLETIANGSGDTKLDKYFRSRHANIEQKIVTFETLWTIFPPGSLIYGKPFQDQHEVLLVQDNTRTWPSRRDGQNWYLLCWTYDWNGEAFKRSCLRITFEKFDGQKAIVALPYYPFKFAEDREHVESELIERGKRFKQFCLLEQGHRMFDYSGEAIFDKKGFSGIQSDDEKDDDERSRSSYDQIFEALTRYRTRPHFADPGEASLKSSIVESRVMVDFESYFRYGPESAQVGALPPDDRDQCDCMDCRQNEGLKAKFRTRFDARECWEAKWEDEQYMLCPPRVLGYILRDKQWAQLQVTNLRFIPSEDHGGSWSNRLKLADGDVTKKMILDLVNSHGKKKSTDGGYPLEVDDIVAEKGKGLVILLYGPPGVGKTSTAETVAIAARKPLFSISVADVGTKAKNVEANFAKIFALATSWQAILLIDEADVFLESRGKGAASSTERNALVSVFLRVLEYYQGILVLTTNQIAQFDVAVHSRIHIAIKYEALNQQQTLDIFDNFLGPLRDHGLVRNMGEIEEWLKDDVVNIGLDGRQIRNIVTSALGLARAQGESKLDRKHLKSVLNNVKDFKLEFIRQYEKYKNSQQGSI
ncbi:MAG: hypothetical protein Q9227_009502 [Pyrenula ochraceoflavens]